MRIFFTSRANRRDELFAYGNEVRALGYEVASRWCASPRPTQPDPFDLSDDGLAVSDVKDVNSSDLVIIFSCPMHAFLPSDSRSGVALGLAIAAGRRVWLVGDPEDHLQAHPSVKRFATWPEAVKELRKSYPPLPLIPEIMLSANADEHGLKFLEKFSVPAVVLGEHLGQYAPTVGRRVEEYRRARRAIYAAALTDWEQAGRPHAVVEKDCASIGHETSQYAEHMAVMHWFETIVKLADMDRSIDQLRQMKSDSIATFHKPPTSSAASAAAVEEVNSASDEAANEVADGVTDEDAEMEFLEELEPPPGEDQPNSPQAEWL